MVRQARRFVRGQNGERVVACLGAGALLAAVAAVVLWAPADKVSGLTVILGVAALIAGAMVAGARDGLSVSASFLVCVLAAAFLGARSAMAAAVLSELTAALRLRT